MIRCRNLTNITMIALEVFLYMKTVICLCLVPWICPFDLTKVAKSRSVCIFSKEGKAVIVQTCYVRRFFLIPFPVAIKANNFLLSTNHCKAFGAQRILERKLLLKHEHA